MTTKDLNAPDKELIEARKDWLDDNDLTIPMFAKSVGIEYHTASRYFATSRVPRALYLKAITSRWPTFPVMLNKRQQVLSAKEVDNVVTAPAKIIRPRMVLPTRVKARR